MKYVSRRKFLSLSATASFGFQFLPSRVWGANDRINVAGIGVGGKGTADVHSAAKAGAHSSSDFQWFILDLTSSDEDVADLAGLFIRNLPSLDGETIHITNFLVLHHSTGVIPDRIGDVFADTIQNSNIGVTFTNITTTGMTVITSAPFTGTIRYLCSVQG